MNHRARRKLKNRIFTVVCWLTASVSVIVLCILLLSISTMGWRHLFTSPITFDQAKRFDWAAVAEKHEVLSLADLAAVKWETFAADEGLSDISDLERVRWASVPSRCDLPQSLAALDEVPKYKWQEVFESLREADWGATGTFLTNSPSRTPEKAGIGPAMWGSIWICFTCALFALPLGIGTAIFLEEYKPRSLFVKRLHGFVQLNIANLAGVPSIVYGILGLTVFVQMFGFGNANDPSFEIGVSYRDQISDAAGNYLAAPVDDRRAPATVFTTGMAVKDDHGDPVTLRLVTADEMNAAYGLVDAEVAELSEGLPEKERQARKHEIEQANLRGLIEDSPNLHVERVPKRAWYYVQFPFGRGVIAGGLTLMLVVLPIVIVSSQESLRAVPNSLREGALGMGATKWQMVSRMTLPAAVPGIMTGSILAMSRAIGEAAPILIIAGIVYITFTPQHLMDEFTAMPLQIYDWAGRPQEAFHYVAASGIIVLLAVLLSFNVLAVFVRQVFHKPLQ